MLYNCLDNNLSIKGYPHAFPTHVSILVSSRTPWLIQVITADRAAMIAGHQSSVIATSASFYYKIYAHQLVVKQDFGVVALLLQL